MARSRRQRTRHRPPSHLPRTHARTHRRRRGGRPQVRRHRLTSCSTRTPIPTPRNPTSGKSPTSSPATTSRSARSSHRSGPAPSATPPWAMLKPARNSCSPSKKPAASRRSSTNTASANTASSASTPPALLPIGPRTLPEIPSSSPRPSAKPAKSPSNTANASPPKVKSAGAACTRGRPCSTPSKRPACRTPSDSRPTSPTPISI